MKLNAYQCSILSRLATLRSRAFGLGGDVGAVFARAASDGWKRHGFAGISAACWDLRAMTADMPGAYGVWEAARDLGSACLFA